jgi:hypothetical protein
VNYTVTITFLAAGQQYDSAPLASLRGDNPADGWCIRIDNGNVSAVGTKDYYPYVNARLPWDDGEHVVEWRVTGDRHELWLDGLPSAECMSRLDLGDADTLRHGEDPEMPGKTYTGVLSVEVIDG